MSLEQYIKDFGSDPKMSTLDWSGRAVSQLPAELRERYTTVASRAGGVGAGELIDGSCSACRITLSHVDMDALLNGPPIANCPSCRRLLVVPPWTPTP